MLCDVVGLASGSSLPRHATLPSSPTGGRAISIFYQFIQFLGTAGVAATANGGEGRFPSSSLHPFADSAKHPAGQPLRPPAGPARPLASPTSGSRGGRPVAVGPIGKQRPKMYFPTSSPSLTSKHSDRPWQSQVAGPQFLLTMIFIATAPRPPPRKFDKSQNL